MKTQFRGLESIWSTAVGLIAMILILVSSSEGLHAIDGGKRSAINSATRTAIDHGIDFPEFDCGYRPPVEWLEEVRAAVARGEIPDPRTRQIPPIQRVRPAAPEIWVDYDDPTGRSGENPPNRDYTE